MRSNTKKRYLFSFEREVREDFSAERKCDSFSSSTLNPLATRVYRGGEPRRRRRRPRPASGCAIFSATTPIEQQPIYLFSLPPRCRRRRFLRASSNSIWGCGRGFLSLSLTITGSYNGIFFLLPNPSICETKDQGLFIFICLCCDGFENFVVVPFFVCFLFGNTSDLMHGCR